MADQRAHSPEPWRLELGSMWHAPVTPSLPVGDEIISGCDLYWINRNDARRIVAAVNACAGIPTEALEAGALGKALDMARDLLARDDFWKRPDLVGFVPGEVDDVADALRALGRLP